MAQDTRLRDIRHFQSGSGMNLDDDARTLKPNEHREIWNSIIGVSESAHASCLENIKGTVSVFDMPINAGLDVRSGLRAVGMCEDVTDNAVVIHLMDTTGDGNHAIMRYHNSNSRCEWILKDEPLLNYQSGYPVISNRIGDLLYWTDGYEVEPFVNYNPPRKINIIRALGYTNPYVHKIYTVGEYFSYGHNVYKVWKDSTSVNDFFADIVDVYCYTEITFQLLDRIKYPPVYPIVATFQTDADYKNSCRLRDVMFQFAYRYVYDDGEKSVLSPFSNIPLAYNQLIDGSYRDNDTSFNAIKLVFDTGPEIVVRIELLVRAGNYGIWKIFDKINKYDEIGNTIISSNVVDYEYMFYNNIIAEDADQSDLARPMDYVPQIVKRQELFEKNRIVDVNYIEGFDNIKTDIEFNPIQYGGSSLQYETSTEYDVETIILSDGDSIARAFICITVDISNMTLFTSNAIWTLSMWESQNLNAPPAPYSGIYISRGSDYPTQILSQWVNQIRAQGYSNFPVFSKYNVPSPYTQTGNSIGIGTLGSYKIAFAVSDYPATPGFPGIGDVRCQVLASAGVHKTSSFKTNSWYELGIEYFDRAGRLTSVNNDDNCRVYIPSQQSISPTPLGAISLKWKIHHKPPMMAVYFRFVCTRRLSVSYFDYFRVTNIKITPVASPPQGFTGNTAIISLNSLTLTVNNDIETMNQIFSKSIVKDYIWQRGDRLRFQFYQYDGISNINGFYTYEFFPDTLDFDIINATYPTTAESYMTDDAGDPIVDANGNKIKSNYGLAIEIPNFNTSELSINFNKINSGTDRVYIEIYRPVQESQEKIFYATGEKLPILNPHTNARLHSGGTSVPGLGYNSDQTDTDPATGVILGGDIWINIRFTGLLSFTNPFPIESDHYSDFYSSNSCNYGQPNIVNSDMRRQMYISYIRYGGIFIQDTQVNELSKFKAEDFIALPEKFGPINFIKEIGFTLKVIQKYKSSSIYIGRQGLTQADVSRDEILYASNNTLGTVTINPHSNYGTEHPLSCIQHEGNLYGYCINSGVIWRDSGNGIRSISQPEEGDNDSGYKIKVLTQTKSRTFATHDVEVFAAYDSRYDIVYFCFVDATDTSESYTIGFHEPSNRWVSFYSFIPEFIGAMKMTTLSWKLSNLWLHNEGTRMNFYGQQYNQLVKAVSNIQPLLKKRFLALTENASGVWHLGTQGDVYIPPDDTYRRGQTSLVKAGAFRDIEGTIYAPFGKNMTTHQLLPTNDDFINGDDLRGNFIELTLRNESTEETNLFSIEVDSVVSNP